jgi:Ulp1 family protease
MYSLITAKGEYNYNNIKKWSDKFNIFNMDKIFFPININNSHWSLTIVFIMLKKIIYFDSLHGNGEIYVNSLMQWIIDEFYNKYKKIINKEDWKLICKNTTCPKQGNDNDCGVFTILCANYNSDNLELTYNQDQMNDFRIRLAINIIHGNLNYGNLTIQINKTNSNNNNDMLI